jgi:hypothetical protein
MTDNNSLARYREVLDILLKYAEERNYSGYDVYDGMGITNNKFLLKNYYANRVITQFFKHSPVNFRKLAGIKYTTMSKTMGLFLNTYTILAGQEKNSERKKNYLEKADHLVDVLDQMQIKGYSGTCWNFGFLYSFILEKPTVVITAIVVRGLHAYYLATGSEKAKSLLLGTRDFILKDLYQTETAEGICFSYTPVQRDCCYNASMFASETLARIYSVSGDKTLLPLIKKSVEFVIAHQKNDGRWNYKIDIETGEEKKQVDFHQAYILESLSAVIQYAELDEPSYTAALERGTLFYRSNQFFEDGRAKWRIPKEYPIDIHNQAEGIIYFSGLNPGVEKDLLFAKKILDWTIENMRSPEGLFYYQVHRAYKIRIFYMRWAQAWMALALSKFIVSAEKKINLHPESFNFNS